MLCVPVRVNAYPSGTIVPKALPSAVPDNAPTTMKFPSLFHSATILLAATIAASGCRAQRAESSGDAASLSGASVTVYAAGDIAECRRAPPEESAAAKTARLIAAGLAQDAKAAVLTLGDNTYPIGLLDEFTGCYDATWGRFKNRTYPAPGNHEYKTPAAVGYYTYFADRAGSGRRGYYSFDLGAWHVVSLNSNLQAAEQERQIAWLKSDLAAHPTRCTLAYWHHPRFSSGGHGDNASMKDFWQALDAAGADVVLAGHDHDYERFAPQDSNGRPDDARGIREFVVGTGGAGLTPLGWTKPNSEISNNTTHGVLRMTLKDNGYEWDFMPVGKGTFKDHGVALCH
jgi:acid phosphatase type 7